MSTSHGCNDDKVVVESFKEALIGRIGAERYRMWFAHGVEMTVASSDADEATGESLDRLGLQIRVRGQFALDRIRNHFLPEIRGAAAQAFGSTSRVDVQLRLDAPPAAQTSLPLEDASEESVSDDSGGKEDAREVDGGCRSVAETVKDNHQNRSQSSANRSRGRSGVCRHSAAGSAGIALTYKTSASASKSFGRGRAKRLSSWIAEGAVAVSGAEDKVAKKSSAAQPALPHFSKVLDPLQVPPAEVSQRPGALERSSAAGSTSDRTSGKSAADFVRGSCNQLAYTAMTMVCQNPGEASPLFISGPTGTGKTHLLSAMAEQFRRFHRMRRVMHLSAEQFTNDFISSVGNHGITSFRRRYREVDALLIDDVQFLGSKKATLREMLYTVETLANARRPLVFSGLQSPTEIQGLSSELAGRMAAGLVCAVQPLDTVTREVIFRRWLEQRCPLEVPEAMIQQLNPMLAGDGRVISGIVNLINTLQRAYDRMPTMDELRQFGGELLRAAQPVATLSFIESAVCETFRLESDTLRGGSQTRAVTQPRMLAMYLARQLTSSAYTEIARHFGGKSHSTAISAENNVKRWLDEGKPIGRGRCSMSTREAIDRVESLLRNGQRLA